MPSVDDSEWPIVTITYPEVIALEEIPAFARLIQDIFTKRGPMVTVADISALNLSATTALHRKKVAEEADRLAQKGAILGEAVVIRNAAVRVLYQGYLWARKRQGHPSRVFDDPSKARAWARRLVSADVISQRR